MPRYSQLTDTNKIPRQTALLEFIKALLRHYAANLGLCWSTEACECDELQVLPATDAWWVWWAPSPPCHTATPPCHTATTLPNGGTHKHSNKGRRWRLLALALSAWALELVYTGVQASSHELSAWGLSYHLVYTLVYTLDTLSLTALRRFACLTTCFTTAATCFTCFTKLLVCFTGQ